VYGSAYNKDFPSLNKLTNKRHVANVSTLRSSFKFEFYRCY
jgi:hypothetical protein